MASKLTGIRFFIFNALAGLGVALLFLSAAELVARSLLPFPLTSITTYQAYADVTYFHRPNSLGYEVSPLDEFKPVRLEYDDAGFRRLNKGIRTHSGNDVVVLLGDSFVEARQVESEWTSAGILQNKFPNKRIINAGCSGYTSTTEFLLLKHRVLNLKPKDIFLFFSFNDYADNFWYFGGYYKQKNIFDTARPDQSYLPTVYKERFETLDNWFFIHSAIYAYLKKLTRPEYVISEWKDVANSTYFNDSPKNVNKKTSQMSEIEMEILNFTHQGILEMASLAMQAGSQFHVVIIPLPPQVNKDEWATGKRIFGYARDSIVRERIYQDRLLEFLAKNNINAIDLLPEFEKNSQDGRRMYLDFDGHFSTDGNRVVAAVLEDKIKWSR